MNQSKHKSSSSTIAVFGNDDLITEILLRVPAKSVLKLKLISKKWLSIISESSFPIRHSRINPHTISALLLKISCHFKQPPRYQFVSFDGKSSVHLSYAFLNFDPNNPGNTYVSQSCNGLLLCSKKRRFAAERSVQPKDYIFNPTTRQFVILPQLPNREKYSSQIRMGFDPSKSPSYRLVCTQFSRSDLRIHVYSPETKTWGLCVDQENFNFSHVNFDNGVFWNDAVHWMGPNGNGFCFLFDKECLLEIPRLPLPENWKDRNFRYFGESGGYLFFIGFLTGNQNPDDLNMGIISPEMSPDQITDRSIVVYAKERGCSKWLVKYCLHLKAIVLAYPEVIEEAPKFSSRLVEISVHVLSFIEGNAEIGPLMVMRIPEGIISYSFKDETFNKILSFSPIKRAACESFTHSETLSSV